MRFVYNPLEGHFDVISSAADFTEFILVDGTRPFTGDQDMGAGNKFYLSQANDAYFIWDNSRVELWIGGELITSWDAS